MKLKALARFAGTYGDAFHRIEALAEVDGRMRVVDMKLEAAREAVLFGNQTAADVYRSRVAVDYDPKGAR
jgi:hypothetical protein